MSIGPGTRISENLVVTSQLGEGGMGSVWLATNSALGNEFAVKVLGGRVNATTRQRFEQEARVLARLEHPHVVRVFDFGVTQAGEPFIVMERLRGADLASRLEATPRLDVRWIQHIVRQACAGLGYAHQLGVIHRDVKPANIFLAGPAQTVKLVDFGAAKLLDGRANLTRTGAFLGTPRFMSPEQLMDSKAVDARSDLWSLGAVVYACVTGTTPFLGEGIAELGLAVLHNRIRPPRSVAPDVSSALDAFLMRALHADPVQRFQSAQAFAEAFDAALRAPASLPSTPSTAVMDRSPVAPAAVAGGAPSGPAGPGGKTGPAAARSTATADGIPAAVTGSTGSGAALPFTATRAPSETSSRRVLALGFGTGLVVLTLAFAGWRIAVGSSEGSVASAKPPSTSGASAALTEGDPSRRGVVTSLQIGPPVTPPATAGAPRAPRAEPGLDAPDEQSAPVDLLKDASPFRTLVTEKFEASRGVESLVIFPSHAVFMVVTEPGALTLTRWSAHDFEGRGFAITPPPDYIPNLGIPLGHGQPPTPELMKRMTFPLSDLPWAALKLATGDALKRVKMFPSEISHVIIGRLELGGGVQLRVFVTGAGDDSALVTYDAAGKFLSKIE